MWDDSERVYEHVPREGDVKVTKPQELSAMAKHGFLKAKKGYLKGFIAKAHLSAKRAASPSIHFLLILFKV